jgi:uncharacterized membrane protein (DUF485 family)
MRIQEEESKPTFYTLINLILQVGILLLSLSAFSIITDQLVYQDGDWKYCLLQSEQTLRSNDPYKSYTNCGITQTFFSLNAILAIIFVFALFIQLLHQKKPNFTLIIIMSLMATSMSFISMIIYTSGRTGGDNLGFKKVNVGTVDDGRKISIANFIFNFLGMICYVFEANKILC